MAYFYSELVDCSLQLSLGNIKDDSWKTESENFEPTSVLMKIFEVLKITTRWRSSSVTRHTDPEEVKQQ